MNNKPKREGSFDPDEDAATTAAANTEGAEDATETVLDEVDVLDLQIDINTLCGDKPLSRVGVVELRQILAAVLEQRNTLVTLRQEANVALGHARVRMSRMNLDAVKASTEARREIGRLRREIVSLTRMSNYNASRSEILGDTLQQTVNALRVYGAQSSWNERTLIVGSVEAGPGAFAAEVLNSPVHSAVVHDNEARLKDQQVQ